MQVPAGQRIFTRSSITNEEYEYLIPSTISNIEASSSEVTFLSSPIDESAHLSNAVIVVSRGKPQLSIETLDEARTITALVHAWRDAPLGIESIARLHALVNGGQASSSTYRDSLVWVDGLRPSDAKLVTGAASTVLPLMRDYIAFIGAATSTSRPNSRSAITKS